MTPDDWTADFAAYVASLEDARKEQLRRIRERGEQAAVGLVLDSWLVTLTEEE